MLLNRNREVYPLFSNFKGGNMRILYLGDIVGETTIEVLKQNLEKIKKDNRINIVFANAENVTSGKGLSYKHYKALKSLGITAFSMGNHTFSKSEIIDYMDDAQIVRPANYTTSHGKDILYINYNGIKIALVNLLGRVYNNTPLDCPFKTMDKLLETIDADYIIVDFHGDATSEKRAFFYDFAGSVSAVIGTHTHVQTNDPEVYKNTVYLTDIGMCGPLVSILGDDKDKIIERFRSGVYTPAPVQTTNEFQLSGVIMELSDKSTIIPYKEKFLLR